MPSEYNSRSTRKRTVKKRYLRKRVKFVLIPLLILFIAVLSYGGYLYLKANNALSGAYEDDERDKSELRNEYVDPKFDNVSILIMGVDENEKRKEDNASTRTDALILATLNKDDKSVKLVSIPRDSLVYIPEVGYEDKITHAHAFGGTKATIETVENKLELPVDYYVKLNFHAFVDVVNAINGVEVDVPYEFKESDSDDKRDNIHLYPGVQNLNGEEALAFSRTRYKDSDIDRGKRQLELIDSVIDKSTSLTQILNYDEIIDAVGNNLSTNMTFTEIKSFLSYATHGRDIDVEQLVLEGEDYQPQDIFYWKLDETSLQNTINKLKSHLELEDSEEFLDESEETEDGDQTHSEETNDQQLEDENYQEEQPVEEHQNPENENYQGDDIHY